MKKNIIASQKTVAQILKGDRFNYKIYDETTNKKIPLRKKFDQLNKRFQKEVIESLKDIAIDPQTSQITDNEAIIKENIKKIEDNQTEIVREYYDIGIAALDLHHAPYQYTIFNKHKKILQKRNRPSFAKNYVVAIYSFNNVREKRRLTKEAYIEAVRNSEHALPYDIDLPLPDEGDFYIRKTDNLLNDVLKFYLAENKDSLGLVAIENIKYRLEISKEQLLYGISNSNGLSFKQLYDIALTLRTMIKDNSPSSANYGMKTIASAYLSILFTEYFKRGGVISEIDKIGLSVDKEIFLRMNDAHTLEDYLKAEEKAFTIFSFKGTKEILGENSTLNGHSYIAILWLADIYHAITMQYYSKTIKEALKLELKNRCPKLAKSLDKLERANSLKEMKKIYKLNFPKATKEFREKNGKYGQIIESGLRIEKVAGGITDSAFLTIMFPEYYKQLNWTGIVARNDGTTGKNIKIIFEICDRKDMPNKELIRIESIDMVFQVGIEKATDIIKKSDATLILDTLSSIGIFPERILKQAKKEGLEREIIEFILDHILGQGKGLIIYTYADDIQVNSGLAISNLITTSLALAFNEIFGKIKLAKTINKKVTTLIFKEIPKIEQIKGNGFYEVQISTSKKFHKDETYTFTTNIIDNSLEVDITLDKNNFSKIKNYYTRARFTPNEEYKKNISINNWTNISTFKINNNWEAETSEDTLSITNNQQTWKIIDEMEYIAESIVYSQWTVWLIGAFAGMQDDSGGIGGINIWVADQNLKGTIKENNKEKYVEFPGAIVPKRYKIKIHKNMVNRLNNGERILRIGLVDPAETALEEVFWQQISHTTRDQSNAWGQLALEGVKKIALGDIKALGYITSAGVPLREKICPSSINPVITRPLKEMYAKYGKKGFSYSITGARSTGSVNLTFSNEMTQNEINKIATSIKDAVDKSIKSRGKFREVEEEPLLYKNLQLCEEGPSLVNLSKEEIIRFKNRFIKPMQLKKKIYRDYINQKIQLHTPKEAKEKLNKGLITNTNPEEDLLLYDERPQNVNFNFVNKLIKTQILPDKQQSKEELKKHFSSNDLRKLGEKNLNENFKRFNTPSINPHEHLLARKQVLNNNKHISKLTPEAQRVFFRAIEEGIIDLLLPLKEEEVKTIANSILLKNDKKTCKNISIIQNQYSIEIKKFNEKLKKSVKKYFKEEKHALTFRDKEFYKLLDEEKQEIQKEINNKKKKKEDIETEEFLLDMLKLNLDPELLPPNHFIFQCSNTYKKKFGHWIQALNEAIDIGGITLGLFCGGLGKRSDGIKPITIFHYGRESDASYLRMFIRRWNSFLNRRPKYNGGFLNIIRSGFTEDAIDSIISNLSEEEKFPKDLIALGNQGLRKIYDLNEKEYWLDLILSSKNLTIQQYNELKAQYMRMITVKQEELKEVNRNKKKRQKRTYFNPKNGLNLLEAVSADGTTGCLGDYFKPNEKYCLKNFAVNGFKLNKSKLCKIFPEFKNVNNIEKYVQQHPLGLKPLSLAKATKLLKNKKALSVSCLMNSCTKSEIGGGLLTTARAVYDIWENQDHLMIIDETINIAPSPDPGGIHLIDKEGHHFSAEGNTLNLAQGAIFSKYHTAFSAGTVFVNLKLIHKILDYDDPDEFLTTPDEEIIRRFNYYMNTKFPKVASVKNRTITPPGGVPWTYRTLVYENPITLLPNYLESKYGKKTIKTYEISPNPGFDDDKTVKRRINTLLLPQCRQANPSITKLPPKELVHPEKEANDWLSWAELYIQYNLINEADFSLERAKLAIKKWHNYLKSNDINFNPKNSDFVIRALNKRIKIIQKNIEKIKSLQVKKCSFSLNDLQNKLLILFREQRESNFILEKLNSNKKKERLKYIAELMQSAKSLIEYPNESLVDNIQIERIFVELKALFDNMAESYLYKEQKLHSFRVSPHKILLITDKDATMGKAGASLQEALILNNITENSQLKPSQAKEVINLALSGIDITILTGATAHGAWTHCFNIIKKTIEKMKLSILDQIIVLERIKILANDASIELSVDTKKLQNKGVFAPKELKKSYMYKDGEWIPLSTLKMEDINGKDTKVNRAKALSATIRVYLQQIFSTSYIQSHLGLSPNLKEKEEQIISLMNFINNLNLNPNDLQNLEDLPIEYFLTIYIPLFSLVEKMVNHSKEGYWKKRFKNIFKSKESTEDKIKQAVANIGTKNLKQFFRDENWKSEQIEKKPLTTDEEIMSIFLIAYIKDSAWTFISLDGDFVGFLTNSKDSRFSGLCNILHNRGFWENIKDNWYKEIAKLNIVDKNNKIIPYHARGGPTYLNCSLCGSSKINYLTGILQDPKTIKTIPIFIGDSITDQGDVPPISKIQLSKDTLKKIKELLPVRSIPQEIKVKTNELNGMYEGLITQVDESNQITKMEYFGSMSQKTYDNLISLSPYNKYWINTVNKLKDFSKVVYKEIFPCYLTRKIEIDLKNSILKFEGNISDEEYKILQQVINNKEWRYIIEKLKKSCENIYKHRLVLRFLLGPLLEMDALDRIKATEAGVVYTEYFFSSIDLLGDNYDIEWWGPTSYYAIVNAIKRVAEARHIYGQDNFINIRDTFLRDIIEELNENHTKHFYLYPTPTMIHTNTLESELAKGK